MHGAQFVRREAAMPAVRSEVVVARSPRLDHHAPRLGREEDFAIPTFLSPRLVRNPLSMTREQHFYRKGAHPQPRQPQTAEPDASQKAQIFRPTVPTEWLIVLLLFGSGLTMVPEGDIQYRSGGGDPCGIRAF